MIIVEIELSIQVIFRIIEATAMDNYLIVEIQKAQDINTEAVLATGEEVIEEMVKAAEKTIRGSSAIIVCTVTLIDIAQTIVNTVGETNTIMKIQEDI